MSRIPCEIIRDLFPSYIDELTSEVTNQAVEAHILECDSCKKILGQMRNTDFETDEKEVKEIDFLKKTKKSLHKKLISGTALVCVLACLFLLGRYYFWGQYVNADYLFYNLEVTGEHMTIAVNSTSNQGIQNVEFHEEEGIVELTTRCVPKSVFYRESYDASFEATEQIRQVWIGDRIVWANGEEISPLTSKLFDVYNPYIGNMPSNEEIVKVLNMAAYTGGFTNELQTSEEPYSWRMIFKNEYSSDRQDAFEERLQNYAYILLAQIGNLDEIVYDYKVDGESYTMSITSEDASSFLGIDIKEAGTDVNLLEKLVRKTGLSNVVLGGAMVESNAQIDFENEVQEDKVMEFTVINYAEDDIYGMSVKVDSKKCSGSQSMRNASGEALSDGENVNFQLIPQDFSTVIRDGASGKVTLSVVDKDGKDYEVQGEVDVDLYWGNQYRFILSGNRKDGYFLGH